MDIKELEVLFTRFEDGEEDLFGVLVSEYSRLVSENPDNVKYVHSYGYLYETLGRRSLAKAEKIYKTAMFKKIDMSDPSAYRIDGQLMSVRNTLGKNKDSIELYKNRVLEYPDDTDEYAYLATAYLNADMVREAKKVIEAAAQISPDGDSHLNQVMGDTYARLGENEKALGYWDKAVTDHTYIGGWYSRAFMLKELGRLEEAADQWRKIIKVLDEHYNGANQWPKDELAKIEAKLKKQKEDN